MGHQRLAGEVGEFESSVPRTQQTKSTKRRQQDTARTIGQFQTSPQISERNWTVRQFFEYLEMYHRGGQELGGVIAAEDFEYRSRINSGCNERHHKPHGVLLMLDLSFRV